MKTLPRIILLVAAAGLAGLAVTGCSRSARAARTLARADRYFAAGQYDEAEVEYKNALGLDPRNAQAIGRLGTICLDDGRLIMAAPFLLRARELQPDNLEVRIKLAALYLAGGHAAEARSEAVFVLERRPQDPEAPLILAGASVKPAEIAEAVRLLRNLAPPANGGAPALVGRALLDFRQRNTAEAEAEVIKAQVVDEKYAPAWTELGVLRLTQRDLPHAEEAFRRAAELSPPRSPYRMEYANFKLQAGDTEAGRRLLLEMTQKTPDYLPAWLRLAQLAVSEKKYDDGLALVARVLARDSLNFEGLLLSGQLQMAKGDAAKAAADFDRLASLYPRSPQAVYQLGMARLAQDDSAGAIDALNRAVLLSPDFPAAVMALAGINLRKGDFGAAIAALKQLLQQRPTLGQAWLMLADAYRGQGNLDEALAIYQRLQQANPRDLHVALLRGLILAQQNKPDEARQAFADALGVNPDYLPALEQLVDLDLVAKQYAAAMQRVQDRIAVNPKLPGLQLLVAKIHLAQGDTPQAEADLRKVIELEPDSPTGYFLLAQLYADSNQEDKALANLSQVVEHDPKNVSALTLIAMVRERQKDYPAARDAYEKVLEVNPRSVIALNNLAYLCSERLGQLDRAFTLAQKAHELFPNEPHAADTLGWILYRRHQYPWALTLLQTCADELPTEAEVQFHLGMVHYMMGEESPARLSLQRALQLGTGFPGAADARQSLAILEIDPDHVAPSARPAVEKSLAARPDDPIALARLAALQEREGAVDQAIATWNAALKAGPDNVTALMNLARLQASRQNLPEAMELAKAARKLAPANPEVTHLLGRLAFQTGDQAWATSLLQEAAAKRPDDPGILADLVDASYSVGRVADAEATARQLLALLPPDDASPRAGKARTFLEMTPLAASPAQAGAALARIEAVLKSDPADVPALMALGAADEQRSDLNAARQAYNRVLARYPAFFPAKKRLAIVAAASPGDDPRAYQLATEARSALPDDTEVARALGILSCRRKDYARAEGLLREAAAARGDDALVQYYLGLAEVRLNKRTEGSQALRRALDLGLTGDDAADVRRVLAEK